MYACLCVFRHTCVCVGGYTPVCMCNWRPEVSTKCHSSGTVLLLLDGPLSGTWHMLISLGSLVRAPSLPPQFRGYKYTAYTWSTQVLGTKLGSSCCHGKQCGTWAISPGPHISILKPNFPMGEIVFRARQSERVRLSPWTVIKELTRQEDLGHTWQRQPRHFRIDKLSLRS